MGFKLVVFDLDGTLIDSSKAILDSLFAAMDCYSVKHAIDRIDSHFFMGKSLKETLSILMPGYSPSVMQKVADHYVSHYYGNQVGKVQLFDGVVDTIKALHNKGIILALATAKHTSCAEQELASTGIKKYFERIQGTDNGVPSKPDPTILNDMLRELDVEPSKTMMVGDTDRDVLFGKNAKCVTCAVTYGNWNKDKFIKECIIPDYFIDDIKELPSILDRSF